MSESQVPPHDNDVEKALLGCLLLHPEVFDDVVQLVRETDFFRPAHQRIYASIMDMNGKGEEVDAITLSAHMEARGELEKNGGRYYLIDLQSDAVTPSKAKQYAQSVLTCSRLRKLVNAGVLIQSLGYDPMAKEDPDSYIGEAVSVVTALAMQHNKQATPVSLVADQMLKNMELGAKKYFSPPGIPWLKFRKGDLVVVAAGTSIGKTALTMTWADEWSKTKNVTYFEYEMEESDLLARLVCRHAGIGSDSILDGTLSAEELSRLSDSLKELRTRNLRIEEVWCDIGTLMAKIRKEAQSGTEVVIVDHLGLIPFRNPAGKNDAKAIGDFITSPLKRLATELGITILILVQLNREGQKDSNYPRLHHLRDSGMIENDASIVCTIWSERLIKDDWQKRIKLRDESGIVGVGEMQSDEFYLTRIGVEKNRNGRTGEKWLLYYGANYRYEDRNEEIEVVSVPQLFSERSLDDTSTTLPSVRGDGDKPDVLLGDSAESDGVCVLPIDGSCGDGDSGAALYLDGDTPA